MTSRMGSNASIAAGLESSGIEVITLPPLDSPPASGPRRPTEYELLEIWPTVDGFLLNGALVTRQALEAGTQLRVGASWIIGTESIDVDAATELGIVIAYGAIPENYLGVSEAVAMLAAALLKRLPAKWQVTRERGGRLEDTGHMVQNSTIGLVGFGNVGRGVAERLNGWGATILATDPYVDPGTAEHYGVKLVDFETLLRSSDVVSVMVTLTDETRKLIGERELGLMKAGSYLINTSRGSCVDEEALLGALDRDHLAGAALDVWEDESNRDNPLRFHQKVIATSHNIGHSLEMSAALPPAAVENLVRGLRGEPPLYIRNPEVLPAWRQRLARLGL
jgi:phosphoglycerate dehydrogenase-like enzyme